MQNRMIRVLMSKVGIDGHWRGVITVSRGLMNEGLEVLFAGNQTAAEIAKTAIEEDVDAIGISIHSGAHLTWAKRVMELLREKGASGITVIMGGVIPEDDYPELERMGIARVFGPSSNTKEIALFIKEETGAIKR